MKIEKPDRRAPASGLQARNGPAPDSSPDDSRPVFKTRKPLASNAA